MDTVLGLILKRHISQRDYGVIILAEGLVDLLDPKDIANLFDGHEEEARHDFNKILLKQVMR